MQFSRDLPIEFELLLGLKCRQLQLNYYNWRLTTWTLATSGLECTLISDVTKILTQSVRSASFFKILVQPEKSISNWPFGDSDIKALKNGIPNLYNNLPHRVSRNIFVLQQNNNMCSVGSNTVSWQRSHSLTHRPENIIPNIRTAFWIRE